MTSRRLRARLWLENYGLFPRGRLAFFTLYVLARCSGSNGGPAPGQSAYESLFSSASSILSYYRGVLDARKLIPAELERIGGSGVAHHKSNAPRHQ